MAPIGPRKDARQRAHKAYLLRCTGRTWHDIAEALGFSSPASACKAVTTHIQRMPVEDQAMARALSAGHYRVVATKLHSIAAKAEATGKLTTAVQAYQTALDAQERADKLAGLPLMQPQEVNVHVHQTATAVVDQARQELLAIAAGRQASGVLPVIDAEVVGEVAS